MSKSGFTAVMVSLSAISMQHASAATVNMPVLVNLVNALDVTLNASMDFGTLAMTLDRAGTATIDPFVNKLFVSGSSGITPVGGQPSAGEVQIRGVTKPITLTVAETAVHLTNGTAFVTVNDFNFLTVAGGPQVTVTPSHAGAALLVPIGATINTKAGQLTGAYTGSNRIFANFQ